jgi:hypothetical protein
MTYFSPPLHISLSTSCLLLAQALEVLVVNALRTLPLSASISQSLRAIFAFVASGTLLPGVDLLDPCVQVFFVISPIIFDYPPTDGFGEIILVDCSSKT